jgi:hypothetical protein
MLKKQEICNSTFILPVSVVADESGDSVKLSALVGALLRVSVGQEERGRTVSDSTDEHALLGRSVARVVNSRS